MVAVYHAAAALITRLLPRNRDRMLRTSDLAVARMTKSPEGVGETKAIRIASVKSAGGYTLRIRWVNGKTLAIDLQEPIHKFKRMHALRDKATFAQVSKGEGDHSVVWPGGIDMGADRLWEMTLEQNGRMDALEFLRWRWRHGLSLTEGAKALDLSRRQVAYYASGERPVPRYVLLALKGWELERKELAA